MNEESDLRLALREAGGYSIDACRFLRDGLAHTVRVVHGEAGDADGLIVDDEDDSNHVSGQQLCFGLRDYALRRYGAMAKTVLNHWGITRTEDFGRIVFALVEIGMMRKTDEDELSDFQGVYDFDEAFAMPELEPEPAPETAS